MLSFSLPLHLSRAGVRFPCCALCGTSVATIACAPVIFSWSQKVNAYARPRRHRRSSGLTAPHATAISSFCLQLGIPFLEINVIL